MQAPLVLIVGYLGAGKTTFLQRVIPLLAARGVRPRVILNDYRDARVDAARLAALDALVTPISGDCICCGSREELLTALAELTLVPGSAALVEANGTSDAVELHDVLALDPRLSGFSRPVQLTVLDARRWQKRWFDKRLEREQALTASHLWCNREVEVSEERRAEVHASLAAVNPGAQLITPEGFADELATLGRDLADAGARMLDGQTPARHHHGHAERHHFASLGATLPPVVSRAALEELVDAAGPRLRRAKGVVALSDAPTRQVVWSWVAGDRGIRIEPLPEGGFATVAVFIGADLPDEALRARIAALAPS